MKELTGSTDQRTQSRRIKYPKPFPKTAGFRVQKEDMSRAPGGVRVVGELKNRLESRKFMKRIEE